MQPVDVVLRKTRLYVDTHLDTYNVYIYIECGLSSVEKNTVYVNLSSAESPSVEITRTTRFVSVALSRIVDHCMSRSVNRTLMERSTRLVYWLVRPAHCRRYAET